MRQKEKNIKKMSSDRLIMHLLLLLHLRIPTSPGTYSLSGLSLPLKMVWQNEVRANTWAHPRQELLLEAKASRLAK